MISPDYGWLKPKKGCQLYKEDGSEVVAHQTLRPGKNCDGYFSNKVLNQFQDMVTVAKCRYPDDDHVFIYDDTPSYLKQSPSALSAHKMLLKTPKPSKNWLVDIPELGSDGKQIFKEATDLFSKAEVPLVINVFPTLLDIWAYLGNVCEDDNDALSPIICIAAWAVISMVDKYIMLCEECEIYFIAIDRKLQWFKDNGYARPVYTKLKQTVIEQWGQTYWPNLAMTSEPEPTHTGNKYLQKRTSKKAPVGNLDDINTYLKGPVVSHLAIIDSGGYMKWWNTTAASHPNLARIGMDYCINMISEGHSTYAEANDQSLYNFCALTSSVDAEWAFSVG
ncbi:hypothetical protein D9756_009845 [Leucocoprinus leucothites]|uniref:Uncharacterized protein n=1 Tax=Leucocoprinus leucothites TaxID=201217 RepID=A0A8H5FU53_9AGAR|nr:hypothetical protein D9756_009845 [Leucoagaricus leucothites]